MSTFSELSLSERLRVKVARPSLSSRSTNFDICRRPSRSDGCNVHHRWRDREPSGRETIKVSRLGLAERKQIRLYARKRKEVALTAKRIRPRLVAPFPPRPPRSRRVTPIPQVPENRGSAPLLRRHLHSTWRSLHAPLGLARVRRLRSN